jgi:tetratricopeptide (TPR) repeat protein
MDVTKHLERADKEAGKKNYDAAVLIYDQIIALDPDCGPARAGKRHASLKKLAKGYPSGLTIAFKNAGASFGVALGKLLRAHKLVASSAERALTNDPKNLKLNLTLGRALLRLGLKGGAEAAFAVVADFDSKDVESLKILGRLYYDTKKWDKSLECYERVLQLTPRDQEATKMRKNLAAEGAIKTGGFESAGSARDLAKSKGQMDELEKRQRLVASSDEIDTTLKTVREEAERDPQNYDLLVRLGTLSQQKRDLRSAVDAFERAAKLRPDDFDAQSRLGDAKLADFEARLREAKEMADEGDEAADDLYRRLVKERRAFRVEEFRRRVAAHPTDLGLRFTLGQYLLDDGQLDEAIAEFQLAVKDPKRKIASMAQLGQAFLKKGLGDLAIKQLAGALDAAGGTSDKTKDIAYALAGALEQTGAAERALDQYAKIFEIDIGYRDVARKIEELRKRAASA